MLKIEKAIKVEKILLEVLDEEIKNPKFGYDGALSIERGIMDFINNSPTTVKARLFDMIKNA